MNPISRRRFDALAGYIRSPWSYLVAQELAWFEAGSEKLLGLASLDTVDGDFVGTVLARDSLNRFRAVGLQINCPTQFHAEAWLRDELAQLVDKPAEDFFQGDEKGVPVDFFTPVVALDKLSPSFRSLIDDNGYTPALGLLKELMHHFQDVDGNFIQQFQSSGFDSRLWELYLYALFTELGYGLDRSHPAPDFHCAGLLGEFFVEATTVNPSADVPSAEEAQSQQYYDAYVPMKYGSALFSKLQKRYWERPHVQRKPLVIAVQDFHAPGAMVWSNSGLVEYLYGIQQTDVERDQGQITLESKVIEKYEWKGKEIPAGFFNQPDTENISAVLANPGGTLPMFSRMGYITGFGDRRIHMMRFGFAYKGHRSPEWFVVEVHDPSYDERWSTGVSIYHNPRAKVPLPEITFPDAAHHTLRGTTIVTAMPEPFFPLGSKTMILAVKRED